MRKAAENNFGKREGVIPILCSALHRIILKECKLGFLNEEISRRLRTMAAR